MNLNWRNWLCVGGIIVLSWGNGLYGKEVKEPVPLKVAAEKNELHPYVESLLDRIDHMCMEEENKADKTQSDAGALQSFLVHSLRFQKNVCVCGPDELARPPVVNFQVNIEKLLIEDFDAKRVEKVIGVIHTSRPATPLCNPVGEVYKSSIAPERADNKDIKDSILKREVTLREFVKRMPLYVTYPRGGLKKRSAEEVAVYKKELSNPENKFLHDMELNVKTIPENLVGATYIITTKDGATVLVSLGGAQAVDTNNQGWQVWVGRLKDTEIADRFGKVYDYLRGGGLVLEL